MTLGLGKDKTNLPQKEGSLPPANGAQCGQLLGDRAEGGSGKDTETQETWGKN